MNKRLELVQEAVSGFIKVAHSLHNQKNLPFGDCLLNKQQILILFFVYNKKVTSSKELAQFLNVTPGAMTQLVDVLVKKKLLVREKNLEDKRIINITLTKELKVKFNNFKNNYLLSANHSFSRLKESDLKILISLLKKIKTKDSLGGHLLQTN